MNSCGDGFARKWHCCPFRLHSGIRTIKARVDGDLHFVYDFLLGDALLLCDIPYDLVYVLFHWFTSITRI